MSEEAFVILHSCLILFQSVPGLIEYLLNRNEEGDMNCKAAKFNIVKTLLDSPFSRNVFPADIIGKFQLHVKQGIVYAQNKTEVAFESAT